MLETELLDHLRTREAAMVAALAELVMNESPSSDIQATTRCASVAAALGVHLLGGEPERLERDERVHLRWRFGSETRVVLAGHLDTVWGLGTIEDRPFEVKDGIASGPGIFDMKAGVVQLLFALSVLDDLEGVTIVLTTDEELGSPTSRDLMKESASGAHAALILEPSEAGALKTARKGVSLYRLRVLGRSAHAGLDPENGVNASVELAHQIVNIAALNGFAEGATVTPTMLAAGSSTNSVPATATLDIDIRTFTVEDEKRLDAELRKLRPALDGASIVVEKVRGFPPLERSSSAALFERAQDVAARLGFASLREASVGGGSDGSLIASYGIPTLDGLGPVGGGAHRDDEHVVVASLPERAALVAALTADLLKRA